MSPDITADENGIFTSSNDNTKWVINVDDQNRCIVLDKFSGIRTSKWRTYESEDMLELITYCMINEYLVTSDHIDQVIDFVISTEHSISDGVLSGFADYLEAVNVEINEKKTKDLQDYCLTNSYEFDLRLLDLVNQG